MAGQYDLLNDYEKSIVDAWDAVIFPNGRYAGGGMPLEDWQRLEESRKPEWDRLLGMAYQESKWIVTAHTASLVAGSRWHNAIALCEYKRASLEITRLLEHSGPFRRRQEADLPILLHVPILLGEGSPGAAAALKGHIQCRVYAPSEIAKFICYMLDPLPGEHQPSAPVSDEVRSLAKSLATARKARKRDIRDAERVQTWADFFRIAHRLAFGEDPHG